MTMGSAVPKTDDDKLDLILAQTTATNGRVGRLEEEVFGDEGHHTPGLITKVRKLEEAVYDARAVLRVAKWALPIVVPGSIAAIVSAVKLVLAG